MTVERQSYPNTTKALNKNRFFKSQTLFFKLAKFVPFSICKTIKFQLFLTAKSFLTMMSKKILRMINHTAHSFFKAIKTIIMGFKWVIRMEIALAKKSTEPFLGQRNPVRKKKFDPKKTIKPKSDSIWIPLLNMVLCDFYYFFIFFSTL
jgi:hypothetical protein